MLKTTALAKSYPTSFSKKTSEISNCIRKDHFERLRDLFNISFFKVVLSFLKR